MRIKIHHQDQHGRPWKVCCDGKPIEAGQQVVIVPNTATYPTAVPVYGYFIEGVVGTASNGASSWYAEYDVPGWLDGLPTEDLEKCNISVVNCVKCACLEIRQLPDGSKELVDTVTNEVFMAAPIKGVKFVNEFGATIATHPADEDGWVTIEAKDCKSTT